jgi:hypothetical protein
LHKGFKCLDISTGRVYISRDVVFDETVFPFADLYPNAGAVLRKEILLLPDHLQNPNQSGLDCTDSIITNQHTILDDGVQEQGCQNQQLEAATNSSTSESAWRGSPSPFSLVTRLTWTGRTILVHAATLILQVIRLRHKGGQQSCRLRFSRPHPAAR